jgi:hypothetical protein
MLGWGTLATASAGAKNFAQIMAIRVLLRILEAGFAPCVMFYMGTFWTRCELATIRHPVHRDCRIGSVLGNDILWSILIERWLAWMAVPLHRGRSSDGIHRSGGGSCPTEDTVHLLVIV